MNKSKLKYVICPGNNPAEEFQPMYKSMYDCWQTVWSEAYKEMKFEAGLYSDAFTRQDYIGGLFYEDRCLALCFFRWANSSLPDFASDSYFSYWNKEDLAQLTLNGPQVIISSNFTIHPLARKGNLDFSMKDLLTGISVEFFMHANADSMAANLRVDKKVNDACAKWGADLIRSNVHVSGGICGDLMVFYKEKVLQRETLDLEIDVKRLWNQRLVISKKINHEENFFVAQKLKAV
jgi:hypothetical protein